MNKIVFNRQRLLETINKGLQNEYTKYLSETEIILQNWRKEAKKSNEVFDEMFKQIFDSKKQIMHKYSHFKTARYIPVIAEQYSAGYLTSEDLIEYSDELKETIIKLAESFAE